MIAVIRPDDVANLGGVHCQYLPPGNHLQLLDKFLHLPRQTRSQTAPTRQPASTVATAESRLKLIKLLMVDYIIISYRTRAVPCHNFTQS